MKGIFFHTLFALKGKQLFFYDRQIIGGLLASFVLTEIKGGFVVFYSHVFDKGRQGCQRIKGRISEPVEQGGGWRKPFGYIV